MWTLLLFGALADEISFMANEVLAASGFMALLLGIFVLISHITLLNMLVGVLVEVVSQVSSAHKERTDIRQIKDAFTDLLRSMDKDDDGSITRSEYNNLVDTLEKINATNPQTPGGLRLASRAISGIPGRLTGGKKSYDDLMISTAEALDRLGMDENDLARMGDHLFTRRGDELDVPEFLRCFLAKCIEMRAPVSRKDFVSMQKVTMQIATEVAQLNTRKSSLPGGNDLWSKAIRKSVENVPEVEVISEPKGSQRGSKDGDTRAAREDKLEQVLQEQKKLREKLDMLTAFLQSGTTAPPNSLPNAP